MTQSTQIPIIGIIGDGQLALMLADALMALHIDFCALAHTENSPMELVYPLKTTKDPENFRAKANVFTLENEFLSIEELKNLLRDKSEALFPKLDSYQHFSNKISQRKLYEALEIPSPQWMEVKDANLEEIFKQGFTFPFIVKASSGGYDGKGVRVVRNPSEFNQVADTFGLYDGQTLLLEEMVSIKKELAQGFLRAQDGSFTVLPLVETVQVNGICQYVYHPAPVSATISKEIESILHRLMNAPLIGIFNFEFFVDANDRVFINEGAPRPHNSQHLTIDASSHSQFDLLARYLIGEDNLPHHISTKTSAMVNILGRSEGPGYRLSLPNIESGIEVHSKLYGKQKCSLGRKMGHVNLIDINSNTDLRDLATKVFKEYHI